MYVCGAAGRSAALLDQVSFLLQVQSNRLRDVTVTLHKGHRCFCVGPTHLEKQHTWDPPSAFWKHWDRVAAGAGSLSTSHSHIFRLVHTNRRRNALFLQCSSPSTTSTTSSTNTQQRRSASFPAANKQRDAAEDPTADSSNKQDEQNLKEASTTTSSSTAKAPGEPEPEGGKPNKTQQLKKVFKEYGAVGVSFHIGMSLMSLGMFYLLVSSGIDMAALLCKLGFSEAVVQSKMAAGTSTFVLAYAIHKLFAPVRISITLVSVPLIVRYFRKTGLFKPPTPAP